MWSRTDRRILLGLLPLAILLVLLIAIPGAADAVTANPPSVAGQSLGIVSVGAALILTALGVLAMHRASTQQSALLAFVGLTLPSAVVMFVAPVLLLLFRVMASAQP